MPDQLAPMTGSNDTRRHEGFRKLIKECTSAEEWAGFQRNRQNSVCNDGASSDAPDREEVTNQTPIDKSVVADEIAVPEIEIVDSPGPANSKYENALGAEPKQSANNLQASENTEGLKTVRKSRSWRRDKFNFRASSGSDSTMSRSAEKTEKKLKIDGLGKQCLACKAQQEQCSGDIQCARCVKTKRECIRSTLKDKNPFQYLVLKTQPSSLLNVEQDKSNLERHCFFDLTQDSRASKDLLELDDLLNTLYHSVTQYDFDQNTNSNRKESLRGLCAFNIFVKTNAILNNLQIPDARFILESFVEHITDNDLNKKFSIDATMRQQLRPLQLELKQADTIQRIQSLRAIASEWVSHTLEWLLRDSNIQDINKPEYTSKKLSLFAIVAVTLQQILDFADAETEQLEADLILHNLARRVAQVLLSYLQPPGPLSYIDNIKLNQCFIKTPVSIHTSAKDQKAAKSPCQLTPATILGVDMNNDFWTYLHTPVTQKDLPPTSHLLRSRPSFVREKLGRLKGILPSGSQKRQQQEAVEQELRAQEARYANNDAHLPLSSLPAEYQTVSAKSRFVVTDHYVPTPTIRTDYYG
ncbi:hypothetical protein BT63DRAFT_440922 [Microthyrium microscopicum]|uniref:Zn(2)-C6 fungal-type domain-containing protein n=1 Tax=Microthyrium microscopicum TaxID=703497 RepID=A0A6A6UD74_9PEZI|nr:hypothetical protein BT63DRAFT_440922 [Microthyrium microscopicum]